MRRILPLTLLCAGTSLSHSALASNICLTQAGDPQLSFPGTKLPYVIAVKPDPTLGYSLYMCSPTSLDISTLTGYSFGDFNHDGFEDLLFGRSSNSGGEIQILLNDSTGSGTVVLSATLATGAGAAPTGLDVLDLDGNGWDDIITSNGSDGTFSVMLNSRGNFSSVKQYAVASDVALLAAVDVNGDGLPDVITESATDQSVSVSLNNGDGTFAAPATYHIGGAVATLTVGDLNGDGHPDIYVASAGVGTSFASGPITGTPGSQKLLNNGDGTFTASAWQPATTGSAGGSISISGGGVTVTATTGVGLFGSSGMVTPPVAITSGTGQIKLPDSQTKVSVVTKSGGKSTTAASSGSTGSTKKAAASSSGGGGMEWLSLMLLGIASALRRKRA